jgi:hypothetical protein
MQRTMEKTRYRLGWKRFQQKSHRPRAFLLTCGLQHGRTDLQAR